MYGFNLTKLRPVNKYEILLIIFSGQNKNEYDQK